MDKRTVALGVAAAAAVAAALLVTLTNHRSTSRTHKAVAAYITRVDAVEQQLQARVTQSVRAYHDFAAGKTISLRLVPQLRRARATIATLAHRLAAVPAPPPARRLRALLVRLTRAEETVAREVAQLASFAPRYGRLLVHAQAAGADLARALAAVQPPHAHRVTGTRKKVAKAQAAFDVAAAAAAAEQAHAVERYDASVAAVERRLSRLAPPPLLRPAYRAQMQTLAASRRAGARLAAALRGAHRNDVALLGRRFTLAARTASSVGAQRAQIAAVKAYDRRVRLIGALQGRIQLEVQRLQAVAG